MQKPNQILSTIAFCASLFFLSNTCDAMIKKINPSKVHVSNQVGQVDLFHGLKGFFVKKEGKVSKVERYFVDKKIRKINSKKLKGFLRHNYLTLNQMSDGEYSVKAHVRGLGGGPIVAGVGYVGTKVVLYGGALAGTYIFGTVAAAAGGITAAAGGLASTASGIMVGLGLAGTATAGPAVAAGAALVAGTAVTGTTAAVTASTAAFVTTATVMTNGIAGAVALVEGAALGVSGALMLLPTP